MSDIKLRIEVNEDAEHEHLGNVINYIYRDGTFMSSNENIANTSIKADNSGLFDYAESNIIRNGINGISFAKPLVFNPKGFLDNDDMNNGKLQDEENPIQFVWGAVPSNKEYSVKLTFSEAENLKDIVIYGVQSANQFPTMAIIDGTDVVYSDDYRWAINLKTKSSIHAIEFKTWNRADYNACIADIKVMLQYYELTNKEIKSIESKTQSTGQPKEIFYGVIANRGSADIIDVDGEIKDMIQDNIIPNSNTPVHVLVNGKQVQSHITTDSEYDESSNARTFSISTTNKLSEWDKLQYDGRFLTNQTSAYTMLLEVFEYFGYAVEDVDKMCDTKIVYGSSNIIGSVKDYLSSVNIPYPYLESATLKETIDKFCVLTQLNVFENDEGNIKFVSSRPVILRNQDFIIVPIKNHYSSIDKDIILKNKYTSIDIYDRVSEKEIDVGSNVYNDLIVNVDTSKFSYSSDSKTVFLSGNETTNNPAIRVLGGSIGNESIYWGILLFINGTYYQDQIIVPKKSNYGLTDTYKVSSINVNVTYDIHTKSISSSSSNPTISELTGGEYTGYAIERSGEMNNSYTYEHWITVNNETLGGTITLTDENNTISVVEEEDKFIVNYKILIGKEFGYMYGRGSSENITGWDGFSTLHNPKQLEISLKGNKTTIKFEDVFAGVKDNSLSAITYNINNNEMIQQNTNSNNTNISSIITSNIVNDYKDGISTLLLTIGCQDYYDNYKNLVKDWSKGEIIQVGDILRLDKDNNGNSALNYKDGSPMLWRVTGRTFKYSGVPLIDLELQEVKVAPIIHGGIYNETTKTYTKTWEQLINEGSLILSDDYREILDVDENLTNSENEVLIINNSIRKIGKRAFENSNIRNINLTNVDFIDDYAFYYSKIETINFTNKIKEIPTYSFAYCENLKQIDIPSSVEIIGARAFFYSGLEYIIIPETVKDFSRAFTSCEHLKTAIVNSLSDTMASPFGGCISLEEVKLSSSITTLDGGFGGCVSLKNIVLPEHLKIIGYGTFYNCAIEDIYIPSTVYFISFGAFEGCSLTNASFGNPNGWIVTGNGVEEHPDLTVSGELNAQYLTETYVNQDWRNEEISN